MEYFKQPGNIIQAGFALRAGKLLAQYSSLTLTLPAHERYDATLAVCVLQSLLTNCTELLKAMKNKQERTLRQEHHGRTNPIWSQALVYCQEHFSERSEGSSASRRTRALEKCVESPNGP